MNYLTSLLKELVAKRKLIWELSKADFRKRFVGSYFGVVWMFIQPMVRSDRIQECAAGAERLVRPVADSGHRPVVLLR